jgi:molybdate transport system substrate-binding protein
MKRTPSCRCAVVGVLFFGLTAPAFADEVTAAVAANFTAAINKLAPIFERATGHKLVMSFGSTGKLYAQIKNGAPFDVFLAADDERPKRLETEGVAVAGTRFTYAIGQLALWSPDKKLVDANGAVLRDGGFAHLAVANSKTAPYGAAAEQVLRRLGIWERIEPRLVRGENITQTFQFVSTGNAALGLVALAQVRALPASQQGSYWVVPAEMHDALRQDAVLLKRGAKNVAARALLDYLRTPDVKSMIQDLGYSTPP